MNTFKTRLTGVALGSAAIALVAAACGSSGGSSNAGAGAPGANSTAGASGQLVSMATVDGTKVLAAADGHTLYSTVAEKGGNIYCVGSCTTFWKPLMATSAQEKAVHGSFSAKLGVVKRPDGGSQLTFDGRPLYTFAEEGAHQLKGNGFKDNFQGTQFVWKAATTSGSTAPSGPPKTGSSYTKTTGGGGNGY